MNLRTLVFFVAAVGFGPVALSAQTASAHKPATKKAATKKAVVKKAVVKKSASRTTIKKRTVTKRAAAQRGPTGPTPERYKEIQDALAAKGYLKSEANGVWDAQSVDAMKRYQSDQKQDPTGKLTAASLIGLGLGPKTALMSTAVPATVKPADVPAPPGVESVPAPQP